MKNLLLIIVGTFLFSCNNGVVRNKYLVKNLSNGQKMTWLPMLLDNDIIFNKGDTVIEYYIYLSNGKSNTREDKCIIIKKL